MVVRAASASLRFPKDATPYYRQMVARDMVARGQHFFASAILLKQHAGHPYVWRHNFCQGIEVLMKGLLLVKDFDRYWPRMRGFGHKLLDVCDETSAAYGIPKPAGEIRGEIEYLSRFYQQHWLRYASGVANLIDANSIAYERTLRRLVAVQRLLSRHRVVEWESGASAT
jgi:hypothetical protein